MRITLPTFGAGLQPRRKATARSGDGQQPGLRIAWWLAVIAVCGAPIVAAEDDQHKTVLRCEVVDAVTGKPLPARVYVRSTDGRWLFARSAAKEGSAVEYRKQRQLGSVEMHTTVSAHPFVVEVTPGTYTLRVEHGKEYLPTEQRLVIGGKPRQLRIELRRWINMAAEGWYSGDTHVHRSIAELPNVMLAEDLNVALPLSYWVTRAYTSPQAGDKSTTADVRPEPIQVDPTHVIYPVNTEYEIFSVGQQRHTLGAVFALGHKTPFKQGVPPVRPIAEEAHRQGALLDLDKHSWPWSMMLVPVMEVDLFELANNHVWQTEFGFRRWSLDLAPAYMHLERDARGFTQWGWIDFGFQTYYALLNCGFRMRPTAGTASGVHPVPLGFGRVYVHLPDRFSYEKWMEGLGAGRSFVTTGPMLVIEIDGHPPGSIIRAESDGKRSCLITGMVRSVRGLSSLEVVVNGRVVRGLTAYNRNVEPGSYESPIKAEVELEGSSWIAVRAFENREEGRGRFAHSSPVHIEIPGRPLRPRREEVDYLVRRMKEELVLNRRILRPEDLKEYSDALRVYEELVKTAR